MRILELFCGIGGVAEAIREIPSASIAAAIDINRKSNRVYCENHGTVPQCRTLESIREIPDADLWWLSPPCQPYTRRGRGRAEQDRRSEALEHLMNLIQRDRPAMLAMENVPEFSGSAHHRRLIDLLDASGYRWRDEILCPTQWGVPMRRRRFYLRATRIASNLEDVIPRPTQACLQDYLDNAAWDDPTWQLPDSHYRQYQSALDIVDADDPNATVACFTSAYGDSIVRAGSYVSCTNRTVVRRFTPAEIAALMGFRCDLRWPTDCGPRDCYRMLGNSLSVTVTAAVLRSLGVLGVLGVLGG